MKPLLTITMGDVNGVGPEILAKALARRAVWDVCRPLVIGDAAALNASRVYAPSCPPAVAISDFDAAVYDGACCPVLDAGVPAPARRPGVLDAAAGRSAVEWTKAAVRLALDGVTGGLVTCPINKEGIHKAGYSYAGHTELVAEMTGSPHYRMCLFAGNMRVVHITSHLSMIDAIAQVQRARIETSIAIADDALRRMGLRRRRIAVAALNPHAGEAGAFGREEELEITPAIAACREDGIDCTGPWPADTLFLRMQQGACDLVVAMYHDQGHIPLKLVAMDEGVNVTLGIPIVRTSVDHGTAYDLAGTGAAREDSLCAAIALAAQFNTGFDSAESDGGAGNADSE